jgi:hypothetical protein
MVLGKQAISVEVNEPHLSPYSMHNFNSTWYLGMQKASKGKHLRINFQNGVDNNFIEYKK